MGFITYSTYCNLFKIYFSSLDSEFFPFQVTTVCQKNIVDIFCRFKIFVLLDNMIYIIIYHNFISKTPYLIIQLKETIAKLETRLNNESRKAEDLQVSIEEANFCGDELSVTFFTIPQF